MNAPAFCNFALCPVCCGSGSLLEDSCPLCDGNGSSILDQLPMSMGQAAPPLSIKPDEVSHFFALPVIPKSSLCLVLDIDGTLLAESENVGPASMASLLRPSLDEFLDFAFASFGAVAIWTAASQEWLDAFLQAVDPDRKRTWAFAWSFSRVSWLRLEGFAPDGSDAVFQHVKRLSKIWKNKALRSRGFLPHTTIIVDNNPAVCLTNYGNAVYIKTYSDVEDSAMERSARGNDDGKGDDWLVVLMHYLRSLHETQVPGQTVRHIDKRGWYAATKEAGLRQRAHTT